MVLQTIYTHVPQSIFPSEVSEEVTPDEEEATPTDEEPLPSTKDEEEEALPMDETPPTEEDTPPTDEEPQDSHQERDEEAQPQDNESGAGLCHWIVCILDTMCTWMYVYA